MKERLKRNPVRVLIVDDSIAVAQSLARFCSTVGMRTVTTNSLEGAGEILSGVKIDGIITDGLRGKWLEVAEMAGEIPVALYTLDDSLKAVAEERGVHFLDKSSDNLVRSFTEFLQSFR